MIASLLGGQVDFAVFSRSLVQSQVESGKLRFLASYGTERWSKPPVPASLAETGLRIDYANWLGVFAPAQTPPDIVARVQSALRAAAQDPAFVESFGKNGGIVSYLDGAEMNAFWQAEIRQASDVIRKIGAIE